MYRESPDPSWAIRAAKLFSRDCGALVLIRFHEEWESVEIVHGGDLTPRELFEAAQMALAKVLAEVK